MEDYIAIDRGQSLSNTTEIGTVINAFTGCLSGKAESTARLYSRILLSFFAWVAESGRSIDRLALPDLNTYVSQLKQEGKAPYTVASYVNAIKRFYRWTQDYKIYPDIAHGLEAPKRELMFRKQPLSLPEVGQLLNHEHDTQSARDFAIVNLLLHTGLRTIEVVRADVSDIKVREGQAVLYVQGKGRTEKDNFVVLTDDCLQPIREYLSTRENLQENQPLFTCYSNHNSGGRLTTRSISTIAKNGLKSIGLKGREYCAHSLRHTAGSLLIDADVALSDVQLMLRHQNPQTTVFYVNMAQRRSRLRRGGEFTLDTMIRNAVSY